MGHVYQLHLPEDTGGSQWHRAGPMHTRVRRIYPAWAQFQKGCKHKNFAKQRKVLLHRNKLPVKITLTLHFCGW